MFRRIGAFFLDTLEVIVFAVGIFFFVYLLIMRPHKIKGASMMPNFPDSEYLLTEKVSYYLHTPVRGDVVVFTPPSQSGDLNSIDCGVIKSTPPTDISDEYIKRVIAVPGERVMVRKGRVYINGELLKEPYIPESVTTEAKSFLCEGQEYTVPSDKLFVMGDNREHSSDSRYWGPIPKKSISGRAWVIYWPVSLSGSVKSPDYGSL
ncbi:MAG: Signal peptidase I [Candidatus Woesebacteria bacterium GW2011_GWB1_38_8]|uniref:Signal peptidase I n=1 Tax=Candidatus Woesebacteria bacterium GW2011_GWB1_38_8 TaxID=1618570 RepID=A0A0G0KYK4_9BACT|nr:MAG: Signal peptidase I [Candidatus Woesebacteria bacterium GW2011_GWB1_38_8]